MSGLKRFFKPLAMAGAALIMLGLAVPTAKASPGDGNNVFWQMLCTVDHFGPNDPIVFPGQPGLSHMHSFYGNITTNASSTGASLMGASSSCGRGMQTSDHSGYWIPSLYQVGVNGSQTLVTSSDQEMFVYYRRPGGTTGPLVHPFPTGLALIGGNSVATSPQSSNIIDWDCGGGGPMYPAIPQCANGTNATLHADVVFPSCWNGTELNPPDHRSHMAYPDPVSGACPAGYPVSLPQIFMSIYYYGNAGGPSYVLSSHGKYTMHGDFFAAWDPQVQNALVGGCLNAGLDCLNVNRDGGQLIAGENSQVTLNLADYPSTPQVVPSGPAPGPTTPAPTTSGPAKPGATHSAKASAHASKSKSAKPSAHASRHAIVVSPVTAAAAAPAAAGSTAHPLTLPDNGKTGLALAGGAVGLPLLGVAAFLVRRRFRGRGRPGGQPDSPPDWDDHQHDWD
jgi:hypothetical protein